MRLCLLLAIVALVPLASSQPGTGARPRPNVVVLETDDQTAADLAAMPNVKRLLAGEGVTFTSSFVSYSLCCPSRATFLTGQHAHNHGVVSNVPPEGGYYKLDAANALPVWLQRAGYATIHLGKYLNGYGTRNAAEIPPGWTEMHGSVDPSTYLYHGVTLNEDGKLNTYSRYSTDLYADKAVDIIRRRSSGQDPFFLWVAFLAPHGGGPPEPGQPKEAPGGPAHRPLRVAPASEAAVLQRAGRFRQAGIRSPPAALTAEQLADITKRHRLRRQSLVSVDEAVARIVEALKAARALDNTLILFTSDNGFMEGQHRLQRGKVVLYEPSIRVPLIITGRAFRKARVCRSRCRTSISPRRSPTSRAPAPDSRWTGAPSAHSSAIRASAG